nr:hypothetical protein [Tanacetum cinerariifolium]
MPSFNSIERAFASLGHDLGSSCGTLYTRDCGCSKGNVEDKILVPKPPKNCARCTRCGYLVDGPNCQGCALLHHELKENLVTYSPDFQNTSEPSSASTNVVNAPREPYVAYVRFRDALSFCDSLKIGIRAEAIENQVKNVLLDYNHFENIALVKKGLHRTFMHMLVAALVDSEDSTVTYTTVSSPYEGRSRDISPGVDRPPVMPEDPYAYVVAVFQALPPPNYVPGPEKPEQAPSSPVYIPYVPEPVYLEYIPLEDDVFLAEEQPLPAAASPTAKSPGYIPVSNLDKDLEEDDDEDPEEDPADYLADHDDDDEEEEPSGDDADEEDEEQDKDDDDEEEEHPTSADSIPPPPALRSDPDEDPEEDDDEDPEEDPADYLADHDDDEEEEEPSGDDADEEDKEQDEDDDDEKEEHPASADSIPPPPALCVTAKISFRPQPPTLSFTKEDAERFLSMPIPPPLPLTPLSSSLPQIPSPPLPASPLILPILLPTASPPLQLLSSDRRADRPEVTLSPRKRLSIVHCPGYE